MASGELFPRAGSSENGVAAGAEGRTAGGRDGYALRLQATDKQVFLLLEHDGEKVGSAYSKRKDSSELALTQAISYAAHMIYKFCEQKTLQESMEGK